MAPSSSSRMIVNTLLSTQKSTLRSRNSPFPTTSLAKFTTTPPVPASPLPTPILPPSLTTTSDEKASSQTARAAITLRRFWSTVGIMPQADTGDYHITLDGRPLRTPSGTRLSVPKERKVLAMLIANEWENQGEKLKVVGLPMTSLASRAMDGLTDPKIRQSVIDELLKYLDTDTTCFPSDSPSPLVRLQETHWKPLHAHFKQTHGLDIKSFDGLVIGGKFRQDERTRSYLREVVEKWDEWEVAALERATYATKSFLIAFALITGRLSAHEAAEASHVEVRSQIELWGEVEDTHDVDYQDIRRQLGSALCLLAKST